jgi:N-acetylmuramoyl-L-alanine amidase
MQRTSALTAAIACWLAAALAPAAAAQNSPAARMYADLLAKERAVRAALDEPGMEAGARKALRTVVGEFELLVKRYPVSGYGDDALWRAAQLSREGSQRLDGDAGREAAVRLLRSLAARYPSSRWAKRVPAELAALASAPRASRAADRSPGARSSEAVTIRGITRTVLPGLTRVAIELDAEVPFTHERLANPDRVYVDLRGTRPGEALSEQTLRFDGDTELVRQIRIGRHPGAVTRVVLEAAGVANYSIYPLYAPYRLVIDCLAPVPPESPVLAARPIGNHAIPSRRTAPASKPAAADRRSAPAEPPRETADQPSTERRPPPRQPNAPPAATPVAAARAADTRSPDVLPADVQPAPRVPAEPLPPIVPPARNAGGGFSVARQLGLGISRIVIDPGHGGHDPGAKGRGITEAELVLDIALRLEKLLATSGVDVVLTRRTDEFVPLQDRTALANQHHADLFLSIHANASRNRRARGIETYYLNFAATADAKEVAARENAASGRPMGELPDLVKTIALDGKRDESRDLAQLVQRSLVQRLKDVNHEVKDLGVKEAPFIVLIGASMPSVLAEVSFVTNTQEARLLRQAGYRQRIAEGLFNALATYRRSLRPTEELAQNP